MNEIEARNEKFMKFERLFFRILLSVFGFGVLMYVVFNAFIDKLGAAAENLIAVFFFMWILLGVLFIIAFIRIMLFIISFRTAEGVTIWRSVINLFLSPVAFVLYYILIFVAAISGCTYAG